VEDSTSDHAPDDALDEAPADANEQLDGARTAWVLAAAAVISGSLLWLQTSAGAFAEWLAAIPNTGHTLSCLFVLVLLGIGVGWRKPVVALFLYPASMLVPVIVMSEPSRASLFAAPRWTAWSLTALVYVVTMSMWISRGRNHIVADVVYEPIPGETSEVASERPLMLLRTSIAILLLIVPVAYLTIFVEGSMFTARAEVRYIFVHMVLVFSWIIAYYAYFASPLMNTEHEAVALSSEMAALRSRILERRRRRIFIYLACMLAGVVVWLWFYGGRL